MQKEYDPEYFDEVIINTCNLCKFCGRWLPYYFYDGIGWCEGCDNGDIREQIINCTTQLPLNNNITSIIINFIFCYE